MARRYRKKNNLRLLLIALVVLVTIFLVYYKLNVVDKSVGEESKKRTKIKKNDAEKKDEQSNKTSIDEDKSTSSEKSTPIESRNQVIQKPSSDEKIETKNENIRKGGNVSIELIGPDEVTISKGSSYKDAGFKATYLDGSDASSEVEVDNAVDISKEGTYTVSYAVGNSVVIRRVTVR